MGLDPGIDHLSAMRIINRVKNDGGEIISFRSYCGGLPAPESNNNLWRYKFSWSPRGVVLAARNDARYLEDGEIIDIPWKKLFENYSILNIKGMDFEAYPNRNSLPYIKKYGIQSTKTMYRGTLRYPGWCELWKKIGKIGLLDDEEKDLKGISYKEFLSKIINADGNIKEEIAKYLGIDVDSEIVKKLEWLGLLSKEKIPIERGSAMDVFVSRLKEKLQYGKGERDMVIMRHEFIAKYKNKNRKEKITSTLIDFGNEDTAMSRLVGLPAAIGAKLILEGKIDLTGVRIPVNPMIYEPILRELERKGINFIEKIEAID
jgi:saccharopine dehydrogenase (NADP+, L-glutamate forming)/spermidine synthase